VNDPATSVSVDLAFRADGGNDATPVEIQTVPELSAMALLPLGVVLMQVARPDVAALGGHVESQGSAWLPGFTFVVRHPPDRSKLVASSCRPWIFSR